MLVLLGRAAVLLGQSQPAAPPAVVAGIPVNYDEAHTTDTPIFHTLGYVMHDGGHGTIPSDWDLFLQFMQMHFQPNPTVARPR